MRQNRRKKLRKCQFYLRDSNLNDLVTDSDRISSAKCVCSLRLMSWSHTTVLRCVVIAEKRLLSDKQKTFNDLTISSARLHGNYIRRFKSKSSRYKWHNVHLRQKPINCLFSACVGVIRVLSEIQLFAKVQKSAEVNPCDRAFPASTL